MPEPWWTRFDEGGDPSATITEQEWLSTTTDREIFHAPNPPFRPEVLLVHLRRSMNIHETSRGKRKLRLFACGCSRRHWDQLGGECRAAIEFAEQFADGKFSRQERLEYWQRIVDAPKGRRFARSDFGHYVLETHAWVSAMIVPDVSYSVFCEIPRWPVEWGDVAFQIAGLIHDIFGNPFRLVSWNESWRTPAVIAMAERIYQSHSFLELPELASHLEYAGCDHEEILAHCRSPKTHVRGCWVIDSILNKRWRQQVQGRTQIE